MMRLFEFEADEHVFIVAMVIGKKTVVLPVLGAAEQRHSYDASQVRCWLRTLVSFSAKPVSHRVIWFALSIAKSDQFLLCTSRHAD